MQVDYSKTFDKQFEKLPRKSQERAQSAIASFLSDPADKKLRNHALKGQWRGHNSISAGGDLRLHFRMLGEMHILFVAVGTHSQLYK